MAGKKSSVNVKDLVKIVSNPLTWAEAVLIDPNTRSLFRANYTEKVILSSKHRFNAIRVHRRAGKCLAPGEYLPLADGSWVQVQDLIGRTFPLWTIGRSGEIKSTWAFASWDDVRDIYEVRSSSGRCIRRTDSHPLYVYPGKWMRVSQIRPGDLVAVSTHLPFPGGDDAPDLTRYTAELCRSVVSGELTRLPGCCFSFPPSSLSSFLRGLWSAAGALSGPPSLELPQVSGSTILMELQVLLLRFGICSRIVGETKLEVLDEDSFIILLETGECSGLEREPFVWEEVEEIRYLGRERAVAVEVPETGTFLSTFYEHNTTSLSVLALWRALTMEHSEILIITPAASQSDNIFYTLREFLRVNPALQAEVVKDVQKPQTLIFSNGSKILGMTAGSQSSKKAVGIRGQGADMVLLDETDYLNDSDFEAINPIILGDVYRREKGSDTVVFAASTPSENRGRFYRWCTSDPLWNKIHIPVTENPDYDEKEIELRRAMATETEWQKEWLAVWPDSEGGLFKAEYIEAAASGPRYSCDLPQRGLGTPRVLGVDWDQSSAGPNLVVLEADTGVKRVKLIFREELPRSEYTMVRAVEHIIALDQKLDFDWIYVDEGFGTVQIELLRKYGDRPDMVGPLTGKRFVDKVVGVNFASNIEVPDPVTGTLTKKPMKPFLVNNLVKLFEDGQIVFWTGDEALKKELMQYRILSTSGKQVQYTKTNDHIISALMLAYHAIFMNYTNPFELRRPSRIYVLPAPKYVPSSEIRSRPLGVVQYDPEAQMARSFADINRTQMGSLRRSGF